jgi:hypothetical protein
MNRYKALAIPSAMVLLMMLTIIPSILIAQETQNKRYYIELKGGVLSGFGPSRSQAELVGGIDTTSFDKKLHVNAGFKNSYPVSITLGYMTNELQLQTSFSYYSLDIGLGKVVDNNIQPLLTAQMMLAKFDVQGRIYTINKGKWNSRYGLFTSLGVSTSIPLAFKMNSTRVQEYGISHFKASVQLNWNIDFCLKIPLGKQGFYGVVDAGLTMPGMVKSIGKLGVEPESSFTATHSKVKMHYVTSSIGLGYYFNW